MIPFWYSMSATKLSLSCTFLWLKTFSQCFLSKFSSLLALAPLVLRLLISSSICSLCYLCSTSAVPCNFLSASFLSSIAFLAAMIDSYCFRVESFIPASVACSMALVSLIELSMDFILSFLSCWAILAIASLCAFSIAYCYRACSLFLWSYASEPSQSMPKKPIVTVRVCFRL